MSVLSDAASGGESGVPIESRRVMLGGGILVAVLGVIAILVPFLTGITLSIIFGALLVVAGVTHAAEAFSARRWRGFAYQTLLAVVYAVAGIALLANPVLALATLTLLLIAFFVVDGIVEIGMAIRLRGHPYWVGVLGSGLLSLVLAGLLWISFPSSATWAVGLLFGINLLSTGLAMVLVSRRVADARGTRSGKAPGSDAWMESTAESASDDESWEGDEDRGGAVSDDED